MKQADLRVGREYALLTYKPYEDAPLAARVHLVSIDGHGKATVRVLDPGPQPPPNARDATPVKPNEQRQIKTRQIGCPWADWSARVAAIRAERKANLKAHRVQRGEYAHRRADRVTVDATRALPQQYDETNRHADTDADERAALIGEYVTAFRLGYLVTTEQLQPLLGDLPVPVLRDILAAGGHRQPGQAGTVAATFHRAAEVLESARVAAIDRLGRTDRFIPHPAQLLGEEEAAFVTAIRDDIATSGGELLLPPVPALPHWVDERDRAIAPVFGWLRMAVAETSGNLLHSPGCHTVHTRPVLTVEHRPWWLMMIEDPKRLCSVCGGPAARDLIALAGFVAAVDVWRDRGHDRIEHWQQAAFQRLLATTAAARAHALEPNVTLPARIVAALADNAPAQDGQIAYALLAATPWNRLGELLDEMPPPQREQARTLARDRLTVLQDALPSARRPLPLPQAVTIEVLRQRYRNLIELLRDTVPQLDRLLFSLPPVP